MFVMSAAGPTASAYHPLSAQDGGARNQHDDDDDERKQISRPRNRGADRHSKRSRKAVRIADRAASRAQALGTDPLRDFENAHRLLAFESEAFQIERQAFSLKRRGITRAIASSVPGASSHGNTKGSRGFQGRNDAGPTLASLRQWMGGAETTATQPQTSLEALSPAKNAVLARTEPHLQCRFISVKEVVMTDSEVRQNVEAELRWEPQVREATKFGVAVKGGVTTLSGNADSYAERWAAERAAERVSGVTALVSAIDVQLPSSYQRRDEEIAAAVVNALKWNWSVPSGRVHVEVRQGIVTLEGDTDYQYQRSAAERAVRFLTGVKGVVNVITLKPAVNKAIVKSDIEAALKRNAVIDAQAIQVSADGHVVTLSGRVRSWAERTQAEQAAWAAPGVFNVTNRITLGV
jgi:osmotically-inducible protein OsmY